MAKLVESRSGTAFPGVIGRTVVYNYVART